MLKSWNQKKNGFTFAAFQTNSTCDARYDEVARLMDRGTQARTVAATAMNATSSRAHTIVELRVRRREADGSEVSSKISLVDLAGSERSSATGATGARLKEGAAINKSLSALGNCIAALAERSSTRGEGGGGGGSKVIPYRDSTLTLLLKESLGGNAKTVMIAALSPAAVNYEETLSTLRYADRARRIKGSATVNRAQNTDALIAALREEISGLTNRLAAAESVNARPRTPARGVHVQKFRPHTITPTLNLNSILFQASNPPTSDRMNQTRDGIRTSVKYLNAQHCINSRAHYGRVTKCGA